MVVLKLAENALPMSFLTVFYKPGLMFKPVVRYIPLLGACIFFTIKKWDAKSVLDWFVMNNQTVLFLV